MPPGPEKGEAPLGGRGLTLFSPENGWSQNSMALMEIFGIRNGPSAQVFHPDPWGCSTGSAVNGAVGKVAKMAKMAKMLC